VLFVIDVNSSFPLFVLV